MQVPDAQICSRTQYTLGDSRSAETLDFPPAEEIQSITIVCVKPATSLFCGEARIQHHWDAFIRKA